MGKMLSHEYHHDAGLLRSYVHEGSEPAFAELVANYQALVFGVAFRWTGDIDSARDVAQQVFAALARKARLLMGRASLGGWLHRAATYEAQRAHRSAVARRTHVGELVRDPALAVGGAAEHAEDFDHLEKAIATLSEGDREALVLHYYQDLSYAEMAEMLGLGEPAARKRVSRALERLGTQLRRRGVVTSVVALLAGAVAEQSSLAVPGGIAQGALAAAATGAGASLFLALTALFSDKTIKATAVALAIGAVPVVWQWQENRVLEERIAWAGGEPALHLSDEKNHTAAQIAPARPGAGGVSSLVRAARQKLRAESIARQSAEAGANHAALAVRKVEQEVVVSLGRRAEVARRVGRTISTLKDLAEKARAGDDIAGRELARLTGGAPGDLSDLAAMIPDIRNLEFEPQQAAEFYTGLLDGALGLGGQRQAVEDILAGHFMQLNVAGLAGPRREGVTVEDWVASRAPAINDLITNVTNALPAGAAGGAELVPSLLTIAEEPTKTVEAVIQGGGLGQPASAIQLPAISGNAGGATPAAGMSQPAALPSKGTPVIKLPLKITLP